MFFLKEKGLLGDFLGTVCNKKSFAYKHSQTRVRVVESIFNSSCLNSLCLGVLLALFEVFLGLKKDF